MYEKRKKKKIVRVTFFLCHSTLAIPFTSAVKLFFFYDFPHPRKGKKIQKYKVIETFLTSVSVGEHLKDSSSDEKNEKKTKGKCKQIQSTIEKCDISIYSPEWKKNTFSH